MSAHEHLSPEQFADLEDHEKWHFDVNTATHEQVMSGNHAANRSRIVLSKEAFPDHLDASLTAAQWGMSGKREDRMTTAVYTRI